MSMTEQERSALRLPREGAHALVQLTERQWQAVDAAISALIDVYRVRRTFVGDDPDPFASFDAFYDVIVLLETRVDPRSEVSFREMIELSLKRLDEAKAGDAKRTRKASKRKSKVRR